MNNGENGPNLFACICYAFQVAPKTMHLGKYQTDTERILANFMDAFKFFPRVLDQNEIEETMRANILDVFSIFDKMDFSKMGDEEICALIEMLLLLHFDNSRGIVANFEHRCLNFFSKVSQLFIFLNISFLARYSMEKAVQIL